MAEVVISSQQKRHTSRFVAIQIRQIILYISNCKGYVDRFVGKLTFAKRPLKHFLRDQIGRATLVGLGPNELRSYKMRTSRWTLLDK